MQKTRSHKWIHKSKEYTEGKGWRDTRLYDCWKCMKQRCNPNSTDPNTRKYREKKITFCQEWESYDTFYEWAVSNGYNNKLTLDRIDNNKGYYPSNCQWITKEENSAKIKKDYGGMTDRQYQAIQKTGKEIGFKNLKVDIAILLCDTGEINTAKYFAKKYGVRAHNITDAANPNCKQKSAGGHTFKKIDSVTTKVSS